MAVPDRSSRIEAAVAEFLALIGESDRPDIGLGGYLARLATDPAWDDLAVRQVQNRVLKELTKGRETEQL
jgi:hypothetical protein